MPYALTEYFQSLNAWKKPWKKSSKKAWNKGLNKEAKREKKRGKREMSTCFGHYNELNISLLVFNARNCKKNIREGWKIKMATVKAILNE